jgi:hypothetical protein
MITYRTSRPAWPIALAALAIALPGTSALAEPSPALDRISVWLGGYRADIDGYASLRDASGNFNTGEQHVLEGKDTVQRARLDWLIMDSQGFSVDYFRLNSKKQRNVSQPFTFGGVNFGVNANIASDTTADVGNVSYRWWFGDRSYNSVFGLGVGAAYYHLKLDVTGDATGGGLAFSGIQSYSTTAWAPLLTLGWRMHVNDAVRLYADFSGSRKNGGDTASVTNTAAGVEWFPWKNIGVGVEYAYTQVRYKKTDDDGNQGRINMNLKGPAAYLRLRF